MGKYCCVNGCKSGREPDRRNRDKNEERQVSLFQIPQFNDMKEKWEKALSQKLDVNQFVCGNHFHEKDILKAHRFVSNGIEAIYPRSRWSLVNKNVIPLEKKIKIKNKNSQLLKLRQPLPERSKGNHVTAGLQLKQEVNHIKPAELYLPSPDVSGVNDVAGLQLKQEFNYIETAFTLSDIKKNFSSVLMEGWCYFATDAEFIFIHMNLLTRKEDKRFSIDKNLSVKVSFSQRPEYSEDVIISSIEDIKTYIEFVSRTVLCKGVGKPDNEFATNCNGKISSDKYKRWQKDPRCLECRKLRQSLVMRECRQKIRKRNMDNH